MKSVYAISVLALRLRISFFLDFTFAGFDPHDHNEGYMDPIKDGPLQARLNGTRDRDVYVRGSYISFQQFQHHFTLYFPP